MPALLALIPVIHALIAGGTITSVLGGLSFPQWLALAEALNDAAPAVVVAISALHPVFEELVDDIGTVGPQHAASAAWKRRQPPTIEGYDSEGGLTQIPNPDYLAS